MRGVRCEKMRDGRNSHTTFTIRNSMVFADGGRSTAPLVSISFVNLELEVLMKYTIRFEEGSLRDKNISATGRRKTLRTIKGVIEVKPSQ